MKRTSLVLAACLLWVAAGAGCHSLATCGDCHHGGGLFSGYGGPTAPRIAGDIRDHHEMKRAARAAQPGPPTPAVTYPYYTLRGPRDFLVDNPPSIGP